MLATTLVPSLKLPLISVPISINEGPIMYANVLIDTGSTAHFVSCSLITGQESMLPKDVDPVRVNTAGSTNMILNEEVSIKFVNLSSKYDITAKLIPSLPVVTGRPELECMIHEDQSINKIKIPSLTTGEIGIIIGTHINHHKPKSSEIFENQLIKRYPLG